MSGLCGVWRIREDSPPIPPGVIRTMCAALAHRGPDGTNTWTDPSGLYGLGECRLNTLSRDEPTEIGEQNPQDEILALVDGPIFNFADLCGRSRKESGGAPPRSRSELVRRLYRIIGEDVFAEIDGEAAIVILDRRRKRLYLSRDAGGTRPLYYTHHNGWCAFASEPGALLELPSFSKEPDPQGLCDYLSFGHITAPGTIFKGIEKVPSAAYTVIRGWGEVEHRVYWDPLEHAPTGLKDRRGRVEHFRDALTKAVEKRALGPPPYAVFTGGIDSSAVAALLSRKAPRVTHTITCDMPVEDFPGLKDISMADMAACRELAECLPVSKHEVIVRPEDVLPSFLELMDSAFDDLMTPYNTVAIPSVRAAREIGAVTGFIADPVAPGVYGAMDDMGLGRGGLDRWRRREKTTAIIGKLMARAALLKTRRGDDDLTVPTNALEFRRHLAQGRELFWSHLPCFVGDLKRKCLSAEFLSSVNDPDSYGCVRGKYERIRRSRPDLGLRERIALYITLTVNDWNLQSWERVCASYSMELRSPFSDRDVLSAAMAVPREEKSGDSKYLIKKAVEDILPDRLIHRKKVYSGTVMLVRLDPLLPEMLRRMMAQMPDSQLAVFRRDAVETMMRLHEEKRGRYNRQLTTILGYFLWYRRWIEGKRDTRELLHDLTE